MPSSVVGTCTTAIPRWYTAAANPATSVTTPPPTATTQSARVRPQRLHAAHRSSTVARVLASSPEPIGKTSWSTPGSTGKPMPGWVTTATRCTPPRQELREQAGDPVADDDVVAPVAELDPNRRRHAASRAATRSATRWAMARFGDEPHSWNDATSRTSSATSRYQASRSA